MPANLEAHADATLSDRNVNGLQLTYAGAAAVLSLTKKISLIVNSSHQSEALASAKGVEVEAITYARKIIRGMGVMETGSTLLGRDSTDRHR